MATSKVRKPTRHDETSEFTRAVDEGGTVTLGEVRDALTGGLLYWARRPFGYNGVDLDRGQVVVFAGLVNDEQLIRLGYVLSVLANDRPHPCRYCASKFINLETLNSHGAKRHADRSARVELPPSDRGLTVDDTAAESQQLEREQDRLEREVPLNMDKTAASRGLST